MSMLQKKILLINPPTPDFVTNKDKNIPLSLLYLASSLQKYDFKVKIIDINNDLLNFEGDTEIYYKKIMKELELFNPDMVGITCLFSGRFKSAVYIAHKIKNAFPNLPIAFGGIHPTIFTKEILRDHSVIDYICIGEGEVSFPKLINAHFNNKELLKEIDGIAYKENKEIKINPKTSFIKDLDELPFPAYDLINLKDYYFNTSKWHNPKNLPINVPVPIITSRSCPNQCTFCSMFLLHGKTWRPRSAKNVVDEIEHMYKTYNHRYFSFMDDNMTLSKSRTLEIVNEVIKRGLNIQFDTPNGLSLKTLDREVVDGLVKAGLVRVCVAPEHGSEFIRNKVMGKYMTDQQIYDFFDIIKDYPNVFVKAFFIIGYPQETKKTLEDTYKMIKKIAPAIDQVSVFNLVPFPGTKIFEDCAREELLSLPMQELHNLETFSNFNESDEPFIKPYDLEKKDLIEFKEKVSSLIKLKNKNQNSKKILITGGNGFIGRNLVEYFSRKYEVLAPSHKELELLDENSVEEFLKNNKIDVVIHTAVKGGSRKLPSYPNMPKENLKMFFNLASNSKYYKKMIFLGSGAEYDKSEGIKEAKESDFGKRIPRDDYGFYKFICSKYIEISDKIVSLRLFGVFGKYEDYETRVISNIICRVLFDLPVEINQNAIFDFVYVGDLCRILEYFVENDTKDKFYNLGGEKHFEIIDIANKIKKISGGDFEIKIKNPGMNKEYTCDSSLLKNELKDFKFTEMDEAIRLLYNWYLENKQSIKTGGLLKY